MTTYNTGNPLGSTSAKDLYDNAENFDLALGSEDEHWTDRLGQLRLTWAGIEGMADSLFEETREQADRSEGEADRAESEADRAEAARDAAEDSVQYDYLVDDDDEREAITGMTAGQRAYVRETEHVWRYDGSDWLDMGLGPTAGKADRSELEAEADARELADNEILDEIDPLLARIIFGETYRSARAPDVEDVSLDFTDDEGRRAVAISLDGEILFYDMRSMAASVAYRSAGGAAISLATDVNGRDALYVEPSGRTFVILNDEALEVLAGQLSVGSKDAWRGPLAATDIRVSADIMRAIINDTTTIPGFRGEILMPRVGTTTQALGASDKMLFLHFIGQSNSSSSGTDVAVLTAPRFPYHVVKLGSASTDGYSIIDGSLLTTFSPASDITGVAAFPQTAAAYSMLYRDRLNAAQQNPIMVRADSKGGAPITDFIRGSIPYTNAMTSITAAFARANEYGIDLQHKIIFVQGENSGSGASGMSREAYRGHLTQLLSDYVEDVKSEVGRVPHVLVWQTNGMATGANDARNGALAQLDESRARMGSSIVLVSPMYMCPMSDNIHLTSLGRLIQGELTDYVSRAVDLSGRWAPLDVLSIERDGVTITVKMNREIQIDTDWVPSVGPGLGFRYYNSGGAEVLIDNVSISGNTVVINLESAVGGTLCYASRDCEPEYIYSGGPVNWAAARGVIFSDLGIESVWHSQGYAVPRLLRLYLVRFEENVS